MPSTYEDLLRLEIQATGENQNTWGTKTNNNLELLADAIAGHVSIAVPGSGNYTLSTSNAATDEARRAFITLSGLLTGNRSIIVPSTAKTYFFRRNTTGAFSITVKTVAGTGVTLPASGLAIVVCDGTETYAIAVEDFFNKTTGGDISGIVSVSVSTSTTAAAALDVFNSGLGPAIEANWISSPVFGVASADTTVAFYAGASVLAPLSTGASRILIESATVSAGTTIGNPTGSIGIYAGGKNPVRLVSDTVNSTWVMSRTETTTTASDLPSYVVDVSGGIRTPGPITIGTAPLNAPIGDYPIIGMRGYLIYDGVDNTLTTAVGCFANVSITRVTLGTYSLVYNVSLPAEDYFVHAVPQSRAGLANVAVQVQSATPVSATIIIANLQTTPPSAINTSALYFGVTF